MSNTRCVSLSVVARMREEAFRSVEGLNERHYTNESLQGTIKDFAVYIVDLIDERALYEAIAHAAWHLMDDSGESKHDDEDIVCMKSHHDRLSSALDALEAAGWDAHPDPVGQGGQAT